MSAQTAKIHDWTPPRPTESANRLPNPLPTWGEWFRNLLPHREDLVVAGREVRGIVIHPIIATAMLGAVVAIGLGIRSEMNWQHDQIVIIATQKADADKQLQLDRQERAQEKVTRESTDEAWRTNIKADILAIKQQQQKDSKQN